MLSAHLNAAFVQAQREISVGSTLGTCHIVEAFLGEGSYGLVWRCRHTTTESREAVKVNKNRPETLRQEIDILRRLRRLDPDTCSIVRWNGYFFHKELICLSFELLDQSLYHYMKDRSFVGLPVTELKPILHQLASALFHLSSVGIVHADLKPENVMVAHRHQRPLKVKLMDFGLGFHVSAAPLGACVQTIGYRAPEVILHAPLNEAIDMWSLGLVAVELASGCRLYPGESEHEVLRFIVEAQGQPADYILDRGLRTERYFQYEEHGHRHWNFKTLEQFQHKMGRYFQDTRYPSLRSLWDLQVKMKSMPGPRSEQRLLVALIEKMLDLDGSRRIKPCEVLQHPLFLCSPPMCTKLDVVSQTAGNKLGETEFHRLPPLWQAAATHSVGRRFQTPSESVPAARMNKGEHVQIEIDAEPRQAGRLRRLLGEMAKVIPIKI